MNWTLFTTIFNEISPTLDRISGMISTGLIDYLAPYVPVALITYVVAYMMLNCVGPTAEPFSPLLRQVAIIIGVWAAFLVAANYTYLAHDFLQVGLPAAFERIVVGANGERPVAANTFDAVWNTAVVAGAKVYKALPWTAIGMQTVVAVYWFCAAVAIAVGFIVWLMASLFLSLLVATGPIFVWGFCFPFLSGMFSSWLKAMASMVVLQVLIATLLTILVAAETQVIANIASGQLVGFDASNEEAQLVQLLGGIILFFIVGAVAWQLPSMAQHLTGGLHLHIEGLVNRVSGAAFGAALAAPNVAAGVAEFGVAAARKASGPDGQLMPGISSLTPPGKAP